MSTARTGRSAWLPGFNAAGLVTAAGILVVWQLLVSTKVVDFLFLPGPLAIAGRMPELLASADFHEQFLHTLTYSLSGWGIGAGIGIVVGSLFGLSRLADQWAMTSVTVVRLIPAIALLPITALIFGLSSSMELVLVTYVAVWPVLVSVAGGIRTVEPLLRDVARTLHLRWFRELGQVVLPSAIGPILVGLRLSLSSAFVVAIVTEMIGNPAGLGNSLNNARNAMQPELTFCYIVVIGVTAVAANAVFNALSRWAGRGSSARKVDDRLGVA
ncbi:ABC transporter permease subunit [Phytohabitans sp. ZYX-F-186]|uniref:ABC transporter permease subunit n=1 Tax=Phytohabitans maris TaxID=3071409 RepID=A0ABU0ZW15_9ACTN|nr:ABC transporter permease subunit [Phytohabitans sp. ZYX-F-186]MDQ7911123.1 ABC transporter permease subunit [Phytohabitans sp. ZYX-F-186]